MKRFGGNPDYILCYVDFMAHLNEDNNIRVLFERALGSNQIAPERSRLIWARFLQFESQVRFTLIFRIRSHSNYPAICMEIKVLVTLVPIF